MSIIIMIVMLALKAKKLTSLHESIKDIHYHAMQMSILGQL